MPSEKYAAFARTYDIEYGLMTEDIPFYVSLAKETGGPALEVAVGTGRVAIPIAREGVPVFGVDNTPEMLGVLRGKLEAEPGLTVTVCEADMRDFDLTEHGPFGLIYCPGRVFLHMLEVTDQLAALANFRRHLRDDGLFAGNVFFPRVDLIDKGQSRVRAWEWSHEYEDPDSGQRTISTFMARHDSRTQRVSVLMRCDSLDEAGRVTGAEVRDVTLTWIWPRELEHLLHRAGFELVDLYGDFERTPFEEGGDEMVWLARRR